MAIPLGVDDGGGDVRLHAPELAGEGLPEAGGQETSLRLG